MPTPIVYKKTLRILTECENTRDIKRIDGRRHEIFHWRISLHDADETDEMRAASLPWIERVEFLLHETFPNPRRGTSIAILAHAYVSGSDEQAAVHAERDGLRIV